MEQLLQWAVKNSDQEALKKEADAIRRGEKPTQAENKFTPELIEAILGKDDATMMREAYACIIDPNDSVENKLIALDNFEMLVEQIDNAKNVESMSMWPSLIAELSSSEAKIRKGVAWVCGTAVQNNPDAQAAFLRHGGLKHLVALLKDDPDAEVRSKAQYGISGLVKHFPEALEEFKTLGGLDIFATILESNQDVPTIRRIVFLLNILVVDQPSLAQELVQRNMVDRLDQIIAQYTESQDEDMVEKAVQTLYTILTRATPAQFPADLKQHLLAAHTAYGNHLGLEDQEWTALLAML